MIELVKRVLAFWSWFWFGNTCENGFDDFFAEQRKGSQCREPAGSWHILARIAEFLDKLLGTQFLEIVGRVASGIVSSRVTQDFTDFGRQIGSRKAVWGWC